MTQITPIPAFRDNYIWLIQAAPSTVAVVDPGDAKPVLQHLADHQLKLGYILITHHHWDHTGGIGDLVKAYPGIPVYGPDNPAIAGITDVVKQGDSLHLDELGVSFEVQTIPGHTLDHIAYFNERWLFCGDTLFLSGCGRLFEGTPEQMFDSLNKLKALPGDTHVYCAHEYTEQNLQFALSIEPDNALLKKRLEDCQDTRARNQPTIPVPLSLELQTNPFLRCEDSSLIKALESKTEQSYDTPIAVFRSLRQLKDNF